MKEYETVIGLEVHVELATKTKIFCGCSTAFGGAANTHVCPVCAGMPGTLPVLNKQVVDYAISVGLAANCRIMRTTVFDRKNYFYPDNPQNYQISQLYLPICRDGLIEIDIDPESKLKQESVRETAYMNAGSKKIRIHEIHMEEDAGKLVHDEENDRTYVDYNRAGVPLIEIVSEPDMRTADEAVAYLEKLRELIRYIGASDCKMQEGSMRADVNLSVREKGDPTYGIRTEMKNLNSYTAVRHAVEAERKRQIAVLTAGGKVIQETRRWDEKKGESYSMRSKEDAKDYRYFPEPDLLPVVIGEEWIKECRKRLPEFGSEKRIRFRKQYAIPDYDIKIMTQSRRMADLFEETAALCGQAKKASNWLMGETQRLLKERGMDAEEISFTAEQLAALIGLTESGQITNTVAKEIFEVMFDGEIDPVEYVKEKGLTTKTDGNALREIIRKVIDQNPKSVEEYRAGKEKVIGFLIGQTMKEMQGKANPNQIKEALKEILNP